MNQEFSGKIGFCIGPDFERPDKAVWERLKAIGTPPLSDGLNKFNTMDGGIKPIFDNCTIAGPAVTVRLRPADNLMLHKSLDYVKEGDILVVDTCGCRTYAVLGDLVASSAFKKGIAGIIVDGGVRDIVDLRAAKYPIFTRFVTPAAGFKDGPGEINYPISCGGVPVHPGDYVVADDNGVVVLPPYLAQKVMEGAEKKLAYEDKRREQIAAGIIVKPEINSELIQKGVILPELNP